MCLVGESATVKKHRRRYMRLTQRQRRFRGPVARRLRKKAQDAVLPLARDPNYYGRALRFMDEFEAFASRMLRSEAGWSAKEALQLTMQELLANEELIELYILALATKGDTAMSVPGEARRYLSAARERLGLSSIVDEAGAIADVVRAHKRKTPKQRRQAQSIHDDDVRDINRVYGCSKDAWEVQVACLVSLGFVALQRLGELLRVRLEGVRFVLRGGGEVVASELKRLPRRAEVQGAFIHIGWTKARQFHDAWIAVACTDTLRVLLRHVGILRREGRTEGPLFPSRPHVGGFRSMSKAMDTDAGRRAIRTALVKVCGYPREYAMLVGGHSLRVGGSNYCRRLGISSEVHRLLGGWASLQSSLEYMQLTSDERFAMATRMGLAARVAPDSNGARPVTVAQVRCIQLGC